MKLRGRDNEFITDEDRRKAEQYIPHVRSLETILYRSLQALPDLEHDLILEAYGFHGPAFKQRTQAADFVGREESQKHLRRARILFAESLRELLERELLEESESMPHVRKLLAVLSEIPDLGRRRNPQEAS